MPVLFIDESKEPKYVLAASIIDEASLARLRKVLTAQRRPRQRSIHFKKEAPARRKELLGLYKRHELLTAIFVSELKNPREARADCFEKAIAYAIQIRASRLVIERDDSIYQADEAMISKMLTEAGAKSLIGFEHFYRHEEPLLWVADSVAWCENRGGDWLRLNEGLVIRP